LPCKGRALNSTCSASSPASCARHFSPASVSNKTTSANFMEAASRSSARVTYASKSRDVRLESTLSPRVGLRFNQVLTKCYSSPPQSNSNENEAAQAPRRNDVSWFSMRVIIALAVLVCLSLGGCSRANQAAYAKPLPFRTAPDAVQEGRFPSGAGVLLVEPFETTQSCRVGHRAPCSGKGRRGLRMVAIAHTVAKGEQSKCTRRLQ